MEAAVAGIRIARNEDISSLLMAVPTDHTHLRLAVQFRTGETLVLQEAAVAAIVRAYTSVKTHPVRRAVKMVSIPITDRKKGYAEHQLIETDAPDDEVEAEMTGLFK